MAKNKISEFDTTAANNTDIDSINIAEGMAPSNVNNAIRALMATLKDFQTGADGDDLTVGGDLTVTGTSTLGGNLAVTGTGIFTSTDAVTLPVGTTAQRNGTPVQGMLRYNSTLSRFEGYNGSYWNQVGGGATGAATDEVFHLNDGTVTTSYTLPTGKNAMSVGTITLNTGVTVTVPSGQRWVIL